MSKGWWKRFLEWSEPCEHDWKESKTNFSSWGENQGTIGYFCKKCGELKVNASIYRNDLEVERDMYITKNKEQEDE